MTRGLLDYLILVTLLVVACWAGASWYGLADVGWPIWVLLGAGTLYMLAIGAICCLSYLNDTPPYRRW